MNLSRPLQPQSSKTEVLTSATASEVEAAGLATVPPALNRDGLDAGASRTARILAFLAVFCVGFVLPVLMVVANKSAPATFAVAALFANLAALAAGRGFDLKRRYLALLTSRTALVVAAVVALFAASLAWSIDRHFTTRGLVEGLPELAFALAMSAAWPLMARRSDFSWLIAGLLCAAALIVFERSAGMPLHALVHARGEAWDLKRSAIPPMLLLWPALAYCASGRRWLLAAGLVVAAVVGIAAAHSGAPGLGLGWQHQASAWRFWRLGLRSVFSASFSSA